MSLDIYIILAWVQLNIFMPAWIWLNMDFLGLPLYLYVFTLAITGYVGTWAIGRFKNVAHQRYDDYFDIFNNYVDEQLHSALHSVDSKFIERETGIGSSFDPSAEFGNQEELYQETDITDMLNDEIEKRKNERRFAKLFGFSGVNSVFDNPRSAKRIRYEQRSGTEDWENEYDTIEYEIDYDD